MLTLVTSIASALGLPLGDFELPALPPALPSDPTGQAVPEGDDEPGAEPDGWAFDPRRCGTTEEVEVPRRRRWVRHKVQSRETIAEIAFRYGAAPWEVRGWNGLGSDVRRVKRGVRLRIKASRVPPPREAIEYTVQEGDTWGSIARAHGATPVDLRAYNYPYRGKMKPGTPLKVLADPIVRDWIAAGKGLHERVPRGGVGVGAPDMGTLLGGVRIPDPDDAGRYWLRLPRTAYGTTHAVTELLTAIDAFEQRTAWTGTLAIGAMSGPRGGALGHHKSHQTGRDVDIRLPRRAGVSRYAELRPRRVDWAAAWDFVLALAEVDTQVIFLDYKRQKYLHRAAKASGADDDTLREMLQYPRGSHARRGLVRHYPGHEKHFHIRFGCGPCEFTCTSATLAEKSNAQVDAD